MDKLDKLDKMDKLKLCEVRMSPMDSTTLHPVPRLCPDMNAHDIVAECERVGPGPGNISTSILPEGTPTPMPKRRHELPPVPPEQLLPPTPCVHVKTKQDAFSPQLLDWCLQRPITVIRGLAQACDLDLSLFTTKTLCLGHPHHPVEIRTQLEQSSDENWDPSLKEQVGDILRHLSASFCQVQPTLVILSFSRLTTPLNSCKLKSLQISCSSFCLCLVSVL